MPFGAIKSPKLRRMGTLARPSFGERRDWVGLAELFEELENGRMFVGKSG
jgi:hypothetical protein